MMISFLRLLGALDVVALFLRIMCKTYKLLPVTQHREAYSYLTAKKKLLTTGIASLIMIAFTLSCGKELRTTHIYGIVTDTNQQPVEGVQIEIEATRRGTLSQGDVLKTIHTNKKGEYSVIVEPDRKYSSIQVINQYFVNISLNDKYSSYEPTKNGQYIRQCCQADIGQKTEYNFVLLPK